MESCDALIAVDSYFHVFDLRDLLNREVIPYGSCAVPDEVVVSDEGVVV